jgi:hypothetical protein
MTHETELVNIRYMIRRRSSRRPLLHDVVTGPGGRQILLEDPSGNPIELFQPAGC